VFWTHHLLAKRVVQLAYRYRVSMRKGYESEDHLSFQGEREVEDTKIPSGGGNVLPG
jgi:hypothetical protein